MDSTPIYGFTYPERDGEDPATPLDMQLLAEQIDAALWVQYQELQAEFRPPTFVAQLTADMTGLGSLLDNDVTLTTLNSTLLYSNAPWVRGINYVPPEAGSYLFGACATFVCSGTIDAGTIRTFWCTVLSPSSPGQYTRYSFFDSDTETGAALGTGISVQGVVEWPQNITPTPAPASTGIQLMQRNGNTSSTMTMKAGAIVWATKISDIES
jgi:hypothetical protein